MDVLRLIGFGVGRDFLWIGNKETGKICSIKQPDHEILHLRCKKSLENETWCLYEVGEPIKEIPTSVADSNWSMNRADGSKISRISRQEMCEMQAHFLVNFPRDQEIPQRIARCRGNSKSPTSMNSHQNLISSVKRTKFISNNDIEAIVGRSSFEGKDKDRLRKILMKHRTK